MKRKTSLRLLRLLPLAAGLLAITSCKKIFDLEPKNAVDQSQMYRDVYDADAAVIGVYGKVMKLARPYILFNELRGDLMDITANSDQYLRQLSEHNVSDDNPYINPQQFYNVIINCNDVLKNFQVMRQENKLKEDEFKQRYSDVGAIRTWLYLQLGIHYGKIPYVTDPLAQVSDLHDPAKFPMVELDRLIDLLVAFAESLPSTDDYPVGTTLQTVVDGYSTSRFFINKNILLGDLYLWDGQYDKAAISFKKVMEINGQVGQGEQFYNQYKISSFNEAGISYTRGLDFSSLVYTPGWRYLFERGQDNPFNWEWIWVLPFDKNFQPENPFIDLFSPNGGSYLVKPSQQAIDYWNSQTQIYTFTGGTATAAAVFRDNFPFDSRGVFSYKMINGQPVIMKYLYNYLGTNNSPLNLFSKQGKWFLARAATLHLHFAEAANRAGKDKVAYALVNRGIPFHYDTLPGASNARDVTKWMQTLLPPPYDFDGRVGDAPPFRNPWYRNQGIRGRAGLKPVVIDSAQFFNMNATPLYPRPLTKPEEFKNFIENMIMEENALELAYEGQRWSDLLRVAIRRNSPAFIADKVYNKLVKSGISAGAAAQARAKLMAKDWFLPFKWQ
jgi:starch-binding outer membrane protein, SusD/RagB family